MKRLNDNFIVFNLNIYEVYFKLMFNISNTTLSLSIIFSFMDTSLTYVKILITLVVGLSMALKRNKQVSVQTGLKREKSDPANLLNFFKENDQDMFNTQLGTKETGDEMMAGDELRTDNDDNNDENSSPSNLKARLAKPTNEDELLNATLIDYETLLKKAKQKEQSEVENESESKKPESQLLQGSTAHNSSIGDVTLENARVVADKSPVSPMSRENQHELDVLAEIRELIKSASSNLNKPSVEYMSENSKPEQRHRTGLGENRVNDVAMKKVAYEDEYPKQHKGMSLWHPTKQRLTEPTEASATALSTSNKVQSGSPSSSLYDDAESGPTISSLERNDKYKLNVTPSSRHKHKTTYKKGGTRTSHKGRAVVKDVGNGQGSLLQTLMRKMQEVKERVDDDTRSYSGGVSLGAIYQGDTPVKGNSSS